jgi:hypothetical protein
MIRIKYFLAAAFFTSSVWAAEITEKDKGAVTRLIKTLYSKSISEVEFPSGTDNMRKTCEYLKMIADKSMLKVNKQGCSFKVLSIRYPNIDNIALSEINDAKKIPGYKILNTSFREDLAVVKVKAPLISNFTGVFDTHAIFFLKKFDKDWKITNALGYLEWPIDLRGEWSDCRHQSSNYQFAVPPTSPSEFEDLPASCRALELDDRRRNGWGKR